ncbi:hypothetical protein SAICODRAFT_9167 [Saitoella complicata NRRL Y-17804]|nr:uncharacterized protein SAICODRAFT_9167 [Saitoella complicata NRRL Y-17804]ODQ51169.1 hypothetical protein SAICODRAFT_9167 [Saitoella complicata NRRL Y-17804]
MVWVLEGTDGGHFAGKLLWLQPGKIFRLGRPSATNQVDIPVEHKTVSKAHLEITIAVPNEGDVSQPSKRSEITVTDLSSKFGTRLDESEVTGRTVKLEGLIHVLHVGKCHEDLRMRWIPIVFCPSGLKSPETKALQQRLQPYDIKVAKEYNAETTHILTAKRNTGKVLRALIDGKYVVSPTYIDVILESIPSIIVDFNLPNPLNYLPSAVEDQDSLFSPDNFAPRPERKSVFHNSTFIFCDKRQHGLLSEAIEAGQGRSLFYDLGNTATAKDLAAFANKHAKGVIVSPVGAEDKIQLAEEAAKIICQATITQDKFLDAVLTGDASILVRPMEVENTGFGAQRRGGTINTEDSRVPETIAEAPVSHSSRGKRDAPLGTDSHAAQVQIVETLPRHTITRADKEQAANDTEASNVVVSTIPQTLPPADAPVDDPDSAPASRPTSQEGGPVNKRVRTRLTTKPSDILDDLFSFKPPLTQRTGTSAASQRTTGATQSKAAAAESQRAPLNDDIFGLSQMSRTLAGQAASQPAPSQSIANTPMPHKRSRPVAEEEEEDYDIAPAATALKRRKLEQELREAATQSSATPQLQAAPSQAVPETQDAASGKSKKRKADDKPDDMILAVAREAKRKKEAAAENEKEDLLQSIKDMEGLRNMGTVEYFKIDPTRLGGDQWRRGERSSRWKPEWDGRPNYKKFRRAERVTPTGPTSFVRMVEHKSKDFGIGDGYWMAGEAPRAAKSAVRSSAARSQKQASPAGDYNSMQDDTQFSYRRSTSRNTQALSADSGPSTITKKPPLFMPQDSDKEDSDDEDDLKFKFKKR